MRSYENYAQKLTKTLKILRGDDPSFNFRDGNLMLNLLNLYLYFKFIYEKFNNLIQKRQLISSSTAVAFKKAP
ncbi:MAG: hypothetical protein COV98_00640 [Candidatus Altarchaeum sp. CG12_big_fil_rev_8_21_14_0_65_33_22]|nr:MAG: hypothetical protein AUK59_03865 [Candidatus Altarchaeum sp. CG2_30_32_3053]PIN68046.1 MAG: hypothetical protein COV98_00640 [Candidatus Altarchaeum sp. CG12_big_fil_rev_8_21_14_0_65_33_22]PIV28701.1 MAG: hypothetical protein COS36_01300 [Candidatus Altarchaeum sp. CG03_land_8_20_14_0_80_32_618]PIX49240.1 MAG: hypothetical protein COZ53_01245 [Candidatus Altarchaeum sp. CG_4_8_14_3_um_filter_33_2054]PIZ31339.1 MAG: hypothetical protein COY41_02640 [Candidatus Altarchaeum sp. CG_4_10_14_